MPRYVVNRVQDALNEAQKPLKGSKTARLGRGLQTRHR